VWNLFLEYTVCGGRLESICSLPIGYKGAIVYTGLCVDTSPGTQEKESICIPVRWNDNVSNNNWISRREAFFHGRRPTSRKMSGSWAKFSSDSELNEHVGYEVDYKGLYQNCSLDLTHEPEPAVTQSTHLGRTCTLASDGEYDWTIRERRRCGLASNTMTTCL